MSNKTPDHIKDVVVRLDNEGFSLRAIKKKISEDLSYEMSHNTVRSILRKLNSDIHIRKDILSDLEKNLEDDEHEHDDVNLYVYTSKIDVNGDKIKVRHEIPFDILNPMVYDYVRGGRSLTQKKVMDKYGIKDKVWNAIKKALNLTKDSGITNEIYLKILEDKFGTQSMEDYVEETAFKSMDRYRELEVAKIDKVEQREIQRVMSIIKSREHRLSKLQDYLKHYKPIRTTVNRGDIVNNDTYDVGISDFHLGHESESVVEKIQRCTQYLLSRPEKNINIMCLGDLVENIVMSGEMHHGQLRHQDKYGFELIMYAVNQLENMIVELYKTGKNITFIGIGGNHDRLAKSHDEDIQREGAMIMYELMKRGLHNMDVDIRYLCEKTNVFDTENIRYIIHHGEDGFSTKAHKNPDKILWDHGDKEKVNVIMHGHLHKIDIEETNNATIIGLPGLAARGPYTKRLDLYSAPGIVGIKYNEYGGIDIHIKRL